MIYDTIAKGDDGLYHVHAFTDEHKRCFIRLDNVVITDATDDITFDINASTAIDEIHEGNIPLRRAGTARDHRPGGARGWRVEDQRVALSRR